MKAILVDDEPDGIRTLKKIAGIELPGSGNCGYLFECDHGKTKAGGNQARCGISGCTDAG